MAARRSSANSASPRGRRRGATSAHGRTPMRDDSARTGRLPPRLRRTSNRLPPPSRGSRGRDHCRERGGHAGSDGGARTAGSARFDEVAEPDPELGSVVVEALAVGICGTDVEIAGGEYGWAPPGRGAADPRARVTGTGRRPGADRAWRSATTSSGIVRRPDPVPCPNCAVGRVGHVLQRPVHRAGHQGGRTGSCPSAGGSSPSTSCGSTTAWGCSGCCWNRPPSSPRPGSRSSPSASARSGTRAPCSSSAPGPIGLLAALIGVQRGLDVHVLDRVTTGPKPALVAELGATYHSGSVADIGLQPGHRRRVHRRRSRSIQAGRPRRRAGRHRVPHRRRLADRRPRRSRRRRWRPTPCSRTWWCSARSTPTAATTTGRPRRWPAPTGRGSSSSITRRVGPDDVDAGAAPRTRRHQGRHGVRGSREQRPDAARPTAVVGRARAAHRGAALARRDRRAAVGRHPRRRRCTAAGSAPTACWRRCGPSRSTATSVRWPRRLAVAACWPPAPASCTSTTAAAVHELAQPEAGGTDVRMNDGACDAAGTVLGRHDGLRRVTRRRGAVPAGARRHAARRCSPA